MTRKDYITFADMFKRNRPEHPHDASDRMEDARIDVLVSQTADIFMRDNPRFDRARFTRACSKGQDDAHV